LSQIHLAHGLTEKGCFHGLRRGLRRAAFGDGSPGNREFHGKTAIFRALAKTSGTALLGRAKVEAYHLS
jgi:hypothetical protein